jgi:hypothetical protein
MVLRGGESNMWVQTETRKLHLYLLKEDIVVLE